MKEIDFLFVSEIVAREENVFALLCAELRRRGYTADYLLSGEWERKLFVKPRVYIVNTAMQQYSLGHTVYSVVGKQKKIVEMHWEQVFPRKYAESEKSSQCNTSKTICKLCWGELFANKMEKIGTDRVRLPVVGNPAFDFLTEKLNKIYLERDEINNKYSFNSEKKIIMYISDFAGYDSTVEGDPYLDGEVRNWAIESQRIILEWFEKLLCDYDDYIVVYRPHPTEFRNSKLRELEDRYESFRVIGDLPLQQWIKVVDYVCTTKSTAIIEAYFLNIPVGVLRPVDESEEMDYEIYDEIQHLTTYNQFIDCLKNRNIKQLNHSIVNRTYANRGNPIYKDVCDFLEKLYTDDELDVFWYEDELKYCRNNKHIFFYKRLKIQLKRQIVALCVPGCRLIVKYINNKWINTSFVGRCSGRLTLKEEQQRKERLISKMRGLIEA